MILSLTAQEPELVRTEYSNILQSNIADIATVHMSFKSNLKAHISISWLHPFKEQKLVVIGNSGMIVFDDTQLWEQKLALYPHSVDVVDSIPHLNKAEVKYINVNESEPLQNECQHFIDVVNKKISPLTDGDEGLRVLKVLSAATLSQNKNHEVSLKNI